MFHLQCNRGAKIDDYCIIMAPPPNDGPKSVTYGDKDPITGDLLFFPFAYALLDDELENYCWYCLTNPQETTKDNESLKRCTGCRVAYFCDRRCLKSGWRDHKPECKAFASCYTMDGKPAVPGVEVRLLGRIITRYNAVSKNDGLYSSDLNRKSQRRIMDIWCHTEDIRNDESAMKKFDAIYAQLSNFYANSSMVDEQTAFELHCRDFINRHAISDRAYLKEIAKGLYLDLCAYDHSCRPNTVYTCEGVVATLRPLNTHVKLSDRSTTFYSYVDLLTSKQQRRKMLKDTWYFDCQCERCLDESEHILTTCICDNERCARPVFIFGALAQKSTNNLEILCGACGKEQSRERITESIGAMRCVDKLVDTNQLETMTQSEAYSFVLNLIDTFKKILPLVNVYYCKLLQLAIQYCQPTDTKNILAYHEQATECLKVCYPKNHPGLAYHLMNIGILMSDLERKQQALPYLQEAYDMLNFVLGPEHSMTNRVRGYLKKE